MKKHTNKIFFLLLISSLALAAGRIQNEDIKSSTDLRTSVLTTTGNLTSGSACITSPASVSGLVAGLFIYDTTTSANVPASTTIAGLPGTCSAGQIQMSANAAGSGTGDTLTFGGQDSQLPNDDKIWLKANGLNETLNAAITNGDLAGSSAGVTRYVLENAVVPYTNINGPHRVSGSKTVSAVQITMLNSGTSGSTTIQINVYRSGSLNASATASLSASSGNPATTSASLSGSLSLLSNDIITVDVNSVAGGAPESLAVEF